MRKTAVLFGNGAKSIQETGAIRRGNVRTPTGTGIPTSNAVVLPA
jgi:hypothetical protein